MNITNNQDVPLPLAVWLLHDDYDHSSNPNQFSVTTLMKPIKQLILAKSVPSATRSMDISELVASRLGTSIHDSIEKAWTNNPQHKLKLLGYSQETLDRLKVNPEVEDNNFINAYLERRTVKQVGNYLVSGKFDFVLDGVVQDFKSTSTYSWGKSSKDDDYRTQLSVYRWLNQDIIFEDYGVINFVFTDWSKLNAKTNPDYPQSRLQSKNIKLMSLDETEAWVKHRLSLIDKYTGKSEKDLPRCTDDELWRSDPVFKYYANPQKTDGRSTKNFDNRVDAETFKVSKGNVGVVLLVPGEVKRCGYCAAFDICQQKDEYV